VMMRTSCCTPVNTVEVVTAQAVGLASQQPESKSYEHSLELTGSDCPACLASPTSPSLPPLGPLAGARFELIRGAPEERFKRIVLQDTCLKVQGRESREWLRRFDGGLASVVASASQPSHSPTLPPARLTAGPIPQQDHLCSCYCWAVQQLAAGQGGRARARRGE